MIQMLNKVIQPSLIMMKNHKKFNFKKIMKVKVKALKITQAQQKSTLQPLSKRKINKIPTIKFCPPMKQTKVTREK